MVITNPETGATRLDPLPVKNSLYGLLYDYYGWTVDQNSYHAPSSWTYEGHEYDTVLNPFYLNSSGSVYGSDSILDALILPATKGFYWTGNRQRNGIDLGAYMYGEGETSTGTGIFVTSFSHNNSKRAYSLRCLTQ